MKLLKKFKHNNPKNPKIRKAVRGIFFDKNNHIPLLFVSKSNYYKIPGGGIDKGEDKLKALKREALEEAGCTIKVIKEVGKTIEYFAEDNELQTSYCYLGKILSKGKSDFTQNELTEGFKLIWTTLPNAIKKLEKTKPKNQEGKIIQKRDLIFLKKAQEISGKN